MERYRKSVYYSTLIHLILAVIVTLQEGPTLPTEELWTYYPVRILIILVLTWALKPLKKDPFNSKLNLLVAVMYGLYSIHGQYYNPWYIFCFIQLQYGIAFLYPISRKTFAIYSAVSSLLFSVVLFWRLDVFVRWAANPIKEDILFTVLCASAVALFANYFFTADRTYREETIRKFGLIGIQSATLVHDIKGLMATPRLYSEFLIRKLSQSDDPEARNAVKVLNESLQQFNKVLIELNRMSTLHIKDVEEFHLHDIIQDVSEALSLDRKQITISNHVNLKIRAEKAHLKSIVFNIILNSMQSFRDKKTPDPLISISTNEKKHIIFGDNAGGFPENILHNLRNEKFHPQESIGTGLGIYLIWDGMRSIGGFAQFRNSGNGAEVVLSLPKHTFELKT